MQVEFLGTGGAVTTPQPGCTCRICGEARAQGIPYSRSGPSLFIHGPNVLIDTPEEIKDQLNRSRVQNIRACFYSHWHPDHVMGRRVWEINRDWRHWPPRHRRTDIYLPQQVAADFRQRLGTWEHLKYFEKSELIRLFELADGDTVQFDNTFVCPLRLAEDYVYAFLVVDKDKRVLIVMDELFGWDPPAEVQGVDLAVLPMGVMEFDPFTGARRISEDHHLLTIEATFDQTLAVVRKLKARQVMMSHIEEIDQLSYDDLKRLEKQLQNQGLTNITFAYDMLLVDV